MPPARFRRVYRSLPPHQREHTSRRLRDLVRSNIYWDKYPLGMLPSEADLMMTYGVPRATVREVLTILRREGVIDRRQGTGTHVVARPSPMRIREMHGAFHSDHGGLFEFGGCREIDRNWVPTPDIVATRLQAEAGEPCLRVEYLETFDGEPLFVATNYVLNPEASRIVPLPLIDNWYELLDRGGLSIGDSEFAIGCVNADERTSLLLNIDVGAAILNIEQLIRDANGRPYNFAFGSFRGDRHSIVSRARNSGNEQGLTD
jgi:GntR family transcriptional regulator